jgi:hypothetical protein
MHDLLIQTTHVPLLQTNVTLQTLVMGHNLLGDEGMRHIMQALSLNQGLQFLSFQVRLAFGQYAHMPPTD